jgi:hypothetical protein
MLVWYWKEDKQILNLGEHITPIICDWFGLRYKNYSDKEDADMQVLLIIGSELHEHKMETFKNDGIKIVHIWGQGRGHGKVFDMDNYDVRCYLVRGEQTRDEYGLDCPVGDPGFIMPKIFPFKHKPLFGVTYAPHHSNRKNVASKLGALECKDWFDVMIHRDIFYERLKRLLCSEFVLTNSLHTMIICRAYGVPFAMSLLDGENLSFPPKWTDVCGWLGIEFELVKNYTQGYQWWHENIKGKRLRNVQPIIDSWPFKKKI